MCSSSQLLGRWRTEGQPLLPAGGNPPATSSGHAPLRGRAKALQGTSVGKCPRLVSGIYLIAFDEFVPGYLAFDKVA